MAVPPPDRVPTRHTELPGSAGKRRPVRLGLQLSFDRRDGDSEIAHLVESTVSVNTAHPAYARAVATRAVGYHVAVSVAMALAPVVVEPPDHHVFLTDFLAKWGEATSKRPARTRRR